MAQMFLHHVRHKFKTTFRSRPKREQQAFPYVIQRQLLDQVAHFEAVVPDDPLRIAQLCGEEEWWGNIIDFITPDCCFWDIGSFTGLLTVYAAQKCSRGRVVSIEPDPNLYKQIDRNVNLNNLRNVVILNVGLSDEVGTLRLNTSGVEGWAPSFFSKDLKSWIDVPVTTLDLLCEEHPNLTPNVLKIDVEGFEYKVIQGGENTLQSQKLSAIYLELHPVFLYENHQPLGKLLWHIENAGFRFKEMRPRKNETHVLAIRE